VTCRGRLRGRTIVVTRDADQTARLRARLEAEGAIVLDVPAISVADDLEGMAELADAVCERWDWVVVTSRNGAARLARAAGDRLVDLSLAVVGPGTAAALREAGAEPALIADRSTAEGLLEVFPPAPGRALLVQGSRARAVLLEGLRDAGWDVRLVVAYRTEPRPVPPAEAAAARAADAIAFTSASTVVEWLASAGVESLPPAVVSIGPVTTAAAERLGLPVHVTADPHTLDGLVDAIAVALGG
jgi:uroporphyrinogen-III synthase